MVPALFIPLEAFPLTANGKIDRKALPLPDISQLQATYVAPRTETEQLLCEIWQDLLGIERVGITDNFFALGGHSLLAMRLVAKVDERFGIEVVLRDIFAQPVLKQQAVVIEASEPSQDRPRLSMVPRTGVLPLSFSQLRLWLLDRIDGGRAHYNMPWAVRLIGRLVTVAMEQAFATIVARHEVLRTSYKFGEDGEALQIIRPFSSFSLEITDLDDVESEEQAELVQQLADAEAAKAFDLSSDLMLRARLLRLGECEHVLLMTLHHIASDGWSMGVLISELTALYSAFSEGRANPLPAL
jgi:acyl carrier protein